MKKDPFELSGKVAVITGAASGIGRELALGLWKKKCHLALVDLDADGLETLRVDLAGCSVDGRVSLHVADVGNRLCMQEVSAEVIDAHKSVHLLINNAGIAFEGAFPQTGLETWERVLAVNLWGTIYGCHFFMPYLAKADRAHIVNMSSLFGFIGMPGQTAYSTSKFAISGFSQALSEELRGTTVGLTVVYPGSVATNIMKTAEGDDPVLLQRLAEWFEKNGIPPEIVASQVISAVQKNKARLLIKMDVALCDFVKRLLPTVGNKAIGDLIIRVMGLQDMREKRRQQWQKTMVEGDPWN